MVGFKLGVSKWAPVSDTRAAFQLSFKTRASVRVSSHAGQASVSGPCNLYMCRYDMNVVKILQTELYVKKRQYLSYTVINLII